MTILVFGAGGQVGRALMDRAGGRAIGLDRGSVDIRDDNLVSRALSAQRFDAVINCAAYTAVDRAESERDLAFAVNAGGAGNVARAAVARGIPILHLSTDYVYAGDGNQPHREEEPAAPIGVYGASKAAGDAAVVEANPAHLILRVSWVFGRHGANFVKTMLRLAAERAELRIVADQSGGPTEARDIADALLTMVDVATAPGFSDWGIYHFSGAPATTWLGFAQAIFARSSKPTPTLVSIASSDYPTAAKRPLNSVLDCGKIARTFGLSQPDWRDSLSRIVAQLEENRP